ncbi:MAG: type II toxin-antitoxin system VapC family toxin [Acidiferrobacterales bacterium]
MSILVDTGAWYAIADASDRHHEEAKNFFLSRTGQARMITTDLVLTEAWALLSSHLGRQTARRFWASLREMQIPILTIEAADLEAAWFIMQLYPDQAFSLVDCTSFALMERTGIHMAFAFDSHFLIYRFGSERRSAFQRLP